MKLGVVLAAALVLAGCTTSLVEPVETPVVEPVETSTPPPATGDTLFTITATTSDNVTLTMTGHASQSWDARPDVAASFIDQCAALGGSSVFDADAPLTESLLAAYGSTLMVIDTTSSPADHAITGGVELLLGNAFFFQVASGDGLTNRHPELCYGGYEVTSTGSVSSITNYETGSATPDLFQWRTGLYGFQIPFDSSATITDCAIELTQLAIDNGVYDVDGWGPTEGTESTCSIGYPGV